MVYRRRHGDFLYAKLEKIRRDLILLYDAVKLIKTDETEIKRPQPYIVMPELSFPTACSTRTSRQQGPVDNNNRRTTKTAQQQESPNMPAQYLSTLAPQDNHHLPTPLGEPRRTHHY